jgi:hypothetical protein
METDREQWPQERFDQAVLDRLEELKNSGRYSVFSRDFLGVVEKSGWSKTSVCTRLKRFAVDGLVTEAHSGEWIIVKYHEFWWR